MLQTDFNRCIRILETKVTELSAALGKREDIGIDRASDVIDETQFATERELALRNLARESELLHRVRRALDRIADSSYGICLHCEETIKPNRMNAIPWAEYCIRCQEAIDPQEPEHQPISQTDALLAA